MIVIRGQQYKFERQWCDSNERIEMDAVYRNSRVYSQCTPSASGACIRQSNNKIYEKNEFKSKVKFYGLVLWWLSPVQADWANKKTFYSIFRTIFFVVYEKTESRNLTGNQIQRQPLHSFFWLSIDFFLTANDSIAVYVQVADVTKAKFIDSLSQCCSQAYITFWHFQLIVVKCVCARTLRSYVGNTKNPFNRCTDQTRCLYIYSRRLWWTTIKLQLCKKRIETDKYINRNECISNSKSYHVIKRVLLRE